MAKNNINTFVSIGIPTLGREAVLLDTIKMVLDQEYPHFELIVANQTTNHKAGFLDQLQAIARDDDRLRCFLVRPVSLPAARNFIIEKAKGQLVLFIDDDVVLKPDFISRHVKAHIEHPEVTAVAGRIKQTGLPLSERPLYFDKYGLPQGTFNCPNSMASQTFPGGNHSVKAEAIKSIGGYHTAYKYDAVREESDTAHRLVKTGYQIYYSAEASLTHLSAPHGGSRVYKAQFDNLRFYINELLFMLRTVSPWLWPISIFKRLRIYSGGHGPTTRLKRVMIFSIGFIAATWNYLFARKDFASTEIM